MIQQQLHQMKNDSAQNDHPSSRSYRKVFQQKNRISYICVLAIQMIVLFCCSKYISNNYNCLVILPFAGVTAWITQQNPQHRHYYLTVARIPEAAQQQQQRQQNQERIPHRSFLQRKVLLFQLNAKTKESPSTASLSDTTIRIRAMASFISMAMIESMISAGVPIEKILRGAAAAETTTQTGISSNTNNAADTNLNDNEIVDKEISKSMHQKEGDRIIALQDEFVSSSSSQALSSVDTEDISPATVQPLRTAQQQPFANVATSTTWSSSSISNSATAIKRDYPVVTSPLLTIPSIPPVISTAFGRPLSVTREHVTPVQKPLRREPSNSNSITSTTTEVATDSIIATTTPMSSNNHDDHIPASTVVVETNATTKSMNEPPIIVTDNDPYGE